MIGVVSERTALEAKVLLKMDRARAAADLLLALPQKSENIELRKRRIEVAEALATEAPAIADRVLAPVLDLREPMGLARRVRAVRDRIRHSAETKKQ